MDTLEKQFVAHVKAIESLCDAAAKANPAVKEAINGHLDTALDALDAVQDLLGDVKDTAVAEAEGAPAPGMSDGGQGQGQGGVPA